MMIDAEMYGMIPSAKIVNRDNAPPENMLNIPRMPPLFWLNKVSNWTGSIPGTGMCAPILNTMSAPSKNQRRFQGKPLAELFADLDAVATCVVI
jgi:hypothetical protein